MGRCGGTPSDRVNLDDSPAGAGLAPRFRQRQSCSRGGGAAIDEVLSAPVATSALRGRAPCSRGGSSQASFWVCPPRMDARLLAGEGSRRISEAGRRPHGTAGCSLCMGTGRSTTHHRVLDQHPHLNARHGPRCTWGAPELAPSGAPAGPHSSPAEYLEIAAQDRFSLAGDLYVPHFVESRLR